MRKWLIIFGFLLLVPFAYGQRKACNGRVFDGITFQPLIGASVYNMNTQKFAFTDKNGQFSIMVSLNDTLVISKSIYRQLVVTVNDKIYSGLEDFFLYYKATMLKEVTIFAINPSYEGFKKDIVTLELPDYYKRVEETKLSEMQKANAVYKPNGNILSLGGSITTSPITYLYDKFSRKSKMNRLYQEMLSYDDEVERIQDKYLETEEITKLFDAMNNRRYLLLSRFLLLSGMRVGEAIALERSDISDSTIKISKTYDPNNNIVTAPKTFDSKREIFIQDELRACIYEIEDYVFHYGDGWLPPSNLFIPDGDGSYISYQAYSKYIRELSEKVLGRRVTPHIFRHTHVSILASVMSLDSIAARLGHADSKVTKDIYLHRTAELKERENQQLNQIHFIQ